MPVVLNRLIEPQLHERSDFSLENSTFREEDEAQSLISALPPEEEQQQGYYDKSARAPSLVGATGLRR